jgi:predicted GNAT family acetyltransferase
MTIALDIVHDPVAGRFETWVEERRCELDYRMQGSTMVITHTGVARQLEGRGIAAQLVQHALRWAREQGHRVQPQCSYVSAYMRRHPEWQDLAA